MSEPLTLERVPAVPYLFGRHARISKMISFIYGPIPFKPLFSPSVPECGQVCAQTPPVISFPTAGHNIGAGGAISTMSSSLLSFSMYTLCCWLCKSCSVSLRSSLGEIPLYVGIDLCVYGGSEFKVFLCHHLGQPPTHRHFLLNFQWALNN